MLPKVDVDLQGLCDEDQKQTNEAIEALLQLWQKPFKKAEVNIAAAQKQRKETYDRKHLQSELSEGCEVLLEDTAQKRKKGGKLDDVWLGPFTTHKSLGKGIYQLAAAQGRVLKRKADISRMKPYKRRAVPASLPTEFPQESVTISSGAECSDIEPTEDTPTLDLDDIKEGRWLSDRVIHAAQLLMKGDDDLLPVGGLQDPLLGQTLSFAVQEGEAVQILHRASTVGVTHPHVRIFDSLHTNFLRTQSNRLLHFIDTRRRNHLGICECPG